MDKSSDHTTEIQAQLDRLHAGDGTARDELLALAAHRLVRLARKMLKGYPGVARWEQTDDVAQNALIRLNRALCNMAPPTARDFYNLAAVEIRRELIDLVRHYNGPLGIGANYSTQAGHANSAAAAGPSTPDLSHDPGRLAAWAEFHDAVHSLSEPDRELFHLLWYQGLSQSQTASVLGISERTVHTRWLAARVRLSDALGGQLPI
jgi:RNA polymerase sigma-70 factor (ECF subfamily)